MSKDRALVFRDFADSLKIEVSDIPPSKEKYLKEFVARTRAVVERKYGKYFGQDTLNRVRGLEERLVSFSPGAFSIYLSAMDADLARAAGKIMGIHVSENIGDIIGIGSRKYVMRQKGSSVMVERIISSTNLSRRQAIKLYKSMVFMGAAVHEITHAYEEPGFPPPFSECAAPYYAAEIQIEMQQIGIIEADGKMRADFYEGLLAEFGEDVHALFFGLNKDAEFKKKVLEVAGAPEIIKVTFPKGYGPAPNNV